MPQRLLQLLREETGVKVSRAAGTEGNNNTSLEDY
jgi:hypothetical protein